VLQRALEICCNVLQCVAVCCGVLQCVAVCCSVLQCVAVCCSVLQWWNVCKVSSTAFVCTGRRGCTGCLIFIGYFPQKSPMINGSFAVGCLKSQLYSPVYGEEDAQDAISLLAVFRKRDL